MANPTLQGINNLISNVVNQYIVRPSGSPFSLGVNGFVFDILEDEEVSIDSDITDHFIEDNYAIHDHWAQKPIKFSLHGYVAEISELFPEHSTAFSILTKVQSLLSLEEFIPKFTTQASELYSKTSSVLSKVNNIANQAANVYDVVTRFQTSATRQQSAYQTFKNFWLSRQLCSVETPYGVFENMAIETIRIVQKGNTKFISDFIVCFKQINIVRSRSIALPKSPNPLGSGQRSPVSDQVMQATSSHGIRKDGPDGSPFGNSLGDFRNDYKGRFGELVFPESNRGQSGGISVVPQSSAIPITGLPSTVPPGFSPPGALITPSMMLPSFSPLSPVIP